MKKGLKTLLLMMAMILAWKGGTINAAAQSDLAEETQLTYHTGYEQPIVMPLGDVQKASQEYEEYQQELQLQPESSYYALSGNEYNWKRYSADYYYTKLSTDEKKLWDALDEVCYNYLTTQVDAYTNGTQSRIPFINCESLGINLTDNQVKDLECIFTYSNPQYYFLSNYYWPYANYVAIGIYSEYANGADRASYTEAFKNQIDIWISDIESVGETQFDKELEAHDLLCDEITYQSNKMDQTAYSAVIDKQTVCAGYVKAYTLLMNGVGIDTVPVTGSNHAWTEVCLDGNWYVVDVTWDDQERVILYWTFNTTYEQVDRWTDTNDSHTPDNCWKDILPACDTEYSSTRRASRSAAPKIVINEDVVELDGYNTIYYTVDGSMPTTRSQRYTESFSVGNISVIKAVSVGWNSTASRVVSERVPHTYTITYHLNGGTNHAENPNSFIVSEDKLVLNNPTRKGYNFRGWYIDQGFVNQVPAIDQTTMADVDLYAKWNANQYAIAFSGNGATSGTMTKLSACQYDKSYTLSANTYKKTGYTFAGWNTKADGSGTSYVNQASVKNLSSTNGATVTLYAQWKLVAVSNLKAETGGYGIVKISWSKVKNAAGYIIYKKNLSTGKFEYCSMTSNTSYTDAKASGADYNFYRVYPYHISSAGTRVVGLSDTYVYAKGTPLAVTNLKAESAGNGKVTLTWTKSSEVTGYIIYKKNNSTGKFEYLYMVSGTSYTDFSASVSDYNYYRVYPYVKDSSGKRVLGASNAYVYAKGVFKTPKNVKAEKLATGKVKLTWDKVLGASGYIIYRKTGDGSFTYLSMSSLTSFTDQKAVSGVYNFYRIYAYYTDGTGKRVLSDKSDYVYMKP